MRNNNIYKFLTSLRLTVACLLAATVLVFVGTIAQVDLGLYKAQNDFFRSVFVYWSPGGSDLRIPVFPGGYLVGGVLLINLIGGFIKYFKFTPKKAGIIMIHAGIILLVLGQFATDFLQVESYIRLGEGETKNYSESARQNELVFIDHSSSDFDEVISIPETRLARASTIKDVQLPFSVNVRKFFPNAQLAERAPMVDTMPAAATQGTGARLTIESKPPTTSMDERNLPAAILEFTGPSGSLGTWLVSLALEQAQSVQIGDKVYEMGLRPIRYYKPFNLELLKFSHDKYMGTDIPKNFSSRVRIDRPATGENRDVLIYMNSPLRYFGETYYQAGFDEKHPGVTILQVVRNSGWLTPYFSCVLVAGGMITQFMIHLLGFVKKRRTAAA